MRKWILVLIVLMMFGLIFVSCSDDCTLNLPDNKLPSCQIQTQDSLNCVKGDIFKVIVNADDPDGNIFQVKFFIDGEPAGSDNEYPYSYDISTELLSEGFHIVRVVAEDSDGEEVEDSLTFNIITYISFGDQAIENSIREFIDKPSGLLYLSDVYPVYRIDARYSDVSDLSGLKYLVNMTQLLLGNNNITDISELSTISSLLSLELSFNNISSIEDLEDLTGILSLNLQGNNISDLSHLINMQDMSTLTMSENNISDISYLYELDELSSIDLS